MTNKSEDPFALIGESMEVFRIEMETINRLSQKISGKTTRIIKIILSLLTVVSIILVMLTFSMSRDLSGMITSLDDMYVEFGSMSDEMGQITTHVTSMGQNVQGMSSIAGNMQHLNKDVGEMQGALSDVNASMGAIDTNVGRISGGTSEMAFRFQNVKNIIKVMGNDIRSMLRPLTAMPR